MLWLLVMVCCVLLGVIDWRPIFSTQQQRSSGLYPFSPYINEYSKFYGVFIYGFGYDCVDHDYKLVSIVLSYSEDDQIIVNEVRVFSLRANCWKRVLEFPVEYFIKFSSEEGPLGYSMCRVVYRKPVSDVFRMIVAFDLATEEYKVVPWPEFCCESLDCEVKLGLLEGCLMVQLMQPNIQTEVWIMKEYGVKESWTKLFSISKRGSFGSFEALKYIAYSKRNGAEEVLIEKDYKKLVRVNVQGGRAKRVNTQGIPSSFEAVLLVESLVSLEDHKEEEAA